MLIFDICGKKYFEAMCYNGGYLTIPVDSIRSFYYDYLPLDYPNLCPCLYVNSISRSCFILGSIADAKSVFSSAGLDFINYII